MIYNDKTQNTKHTYIYRYFLESFLDVYTEKGPLDPLNLQFHASCTQLNSKLESWGLYPSLTAEDLGCLQDQRNQRDQRNQWNQQTAEDLGCLQDLQDQRNQRNQRNQRKQQDPRNPQESELKDEIKDEIKDEENNGLKGEVEDEVKDNHIQEGLSSIQTQTQTRTRRVRKSKGKVHLYACIQIPRKMHPLFDAVIVGVLKKDPISRILLDWRIDKNDKFISRWVLAAQAIDMDITERQLRERLVFIPRLPHYEYMQVCL